MSEQIVNSLPMIARLASALGLEAHELVSPAPGLLLEKDRRGFNVFHVEDAAGSPYIPAQDFVDRHGVVSVIGFGFLVPPAHVVATILFSRERISQERAELFKTVALSMKLGMLPLASSRAFDEPLA